MTGLYAPQPGVFVGRPPCTCGAAYRLHHAEPGGLRCPVAYRPGSLAEAQRALADAEASGNPERVFIARGDIQRLGGKR